VSIFDRIFRRRGKTTDNRDQDDLLSMTDFIRRAEQEVERLIEADTGWYRNLPYQGAMSITKAKEYEIEKWAVWNRVIYDAKRSRLAGLKWSCRNDSLSCPECIKNHDRIFTLDQYDRLASKSRHLGCRCELIPIQSI